MKDHKRNQRVPLFERSTDLGMNLLQDLWESASLLNLHTFPSPNQPPSPQESTLMLVIVLATIITPPMAIMKSLLVQLMSQD